MNSLLIALVGGGLAAAEWIDIGGKVEDGLTVYRLYVDPDNIHHNGDVVTLWALFDYTSIQSIVGGPWLSSKAQRQFDCAEKRIRLLGYMTFTGNMGSGEPVFSNLDESRWEPIALCRPYKRGGNRTLSLGLPVRPGRDRGEESR